MHKSTEDLENELDRGKKAKFADTAPETHLHLTAGSPALTSFRVKAFVVMSA
jgi:hypothetical protein